MKRIGPPEGRWEVLGEGVITLNRMVWVGLNDPGFGPHHSF